MEILPLLPIALLIAIAAFSLGRFTATDPSEDEMVRRLVDARVRRKLTMLTEDEVETEVRAARDRIIGVSA